MITEQMKQPFHALSTADALAAVEASADGLNRDEVTRRLEVHGANRLPEPPRRSAFLRFLSHFHNLLIYVLLASAAVTAALGHGIDTGVILAVVLVNAVIGFIQEGRAEQAMEAIRGMLAPRSAVLRDGRRTSVDAADLVPGDIVLVEPGDRVPADLRLIEARGLSAEEAILTGESVPVDKRTAPVDAEAALGDRSSMLFSGTLVAAGTGRGVVVATGANDADRPDQRDARQRRNTDHPFGATDGHLRTLADGVHPAGRRQLARLRLLRRPSAL